MSKRRRPRGKTPIAIVRRQGSAAARVFLKQAERLAHGGNARAATAQFQRAVNADPADAGLRYKFGKHLLDQHEQELGILQLEKAVALDAGAAAPLLELGQAYTSTNRFDKAQPLLDRALELAGIASQTHLIYGTFLHKQGNLPDAVAHFRTALTLMLEHPAEAARPKPKGGFRQTGGRAPAVDDAEPTCACRRACVCRVRDVARHRARRRAIALRQGPRHRLAAK